VLHFIIEIADKKKQIDHYYQLFGVIFFRFKEREFWKYQKSRLKEFGDPNAIPKLLKGVVTEFLREAIYPEQAVRKICKRYPL
jgi:hypothetical protein